MPPWHPGPWDPGNPGLAPPFSAGGRIARIAWTVKECSRQTLIQRKDGDQRSMADLPVPSPEKTVNVQDGWYKFVMAR